jgi:hypothetical protein
VAVITAQVKDLHQQANQLMDEAKQKQVLVGELIFKSHNEPVQGSFSVEHDERGRPTHLLWEKTS